MDNLYIVIPAYNEESNIDKVIREWHEVVVKIGGNSKLVVVDDGSKDGTYKKLLNLKDELAYLVPITKSNGGHGAAILYGYNYAIIHQAEYIFQTDSDGQTFAFEFWQFWQNRQDYEVQIGYRKKRQDGFLRVMISKTLKLTLAIIFKLNIADANAPFRLMRTCIVKKYISLVPEGFNFSNVLLSVLFEKNKVLMRYVPITFRQRQEGRSFVNLKNVFKIGLKAIKDFICVKKHLEIVK